MLFKLLASFQERQPPVPADTMRQVDHQIAFTERQETVNRPPEVPASCSDDLLPSKQLGAADQHSLCRDQTEPMRQMADGELDEAQKTADLIVPCASRAVKILDRIALSEMPEPELSDIPQQVLSGLIRNLRTRIS